MDESPPTSRRHFLAGLGVASASAVAGCSERLWWRAENPSLEQVSLTIKTVPADDDSIATKISSQLAENLGLAGIDASHEPIAEADLYREVLVQRDFDLFVIRHPGFDDVDALRTLLHSDFRGESGWQNPFSFTDRTVDNLLDAQRTTAGDEREGHVFDLYQYLERRAPYTAVAYPHSIGGAKTEFDVTLPPRRPVDYLDLLTRSPPDGTRDGPLRIGLFGEGLTDRFNPIDVHHGDVSSVLGLVYDPLVRRVDGEFAPWLAEDISWERTNDRLTASVTLRHGLQWHDGESIEPDDVVFTVEFLGDTSLGETESPVPATLYRGRQSLIDSATATDPRTITISFSGTSQEVARRALTIPILPEHVWEPRSELVTDHQTEALTTDNTDPIGSGLFTIAESPSAELIGLEPFDEHPLWDVTATNRPQLLGGFSRFQGFEFRISPNAGSAIELLATDEIDIIAGGLPPSKATAITERDDLRALLAPTESFYMIGYDVRHPELGNPQFRTILSRLVDRTHVVEEFFEGYAVPATSLGEFFGSRRPALETNDASILAEFPGANGEINERIVQSQFRDAGYRYDEGSLLE